MTNEFTARLKAVDRITLTPLVRNALENDAADVVDWNYQPIHGGFAQEMGHSYGIYRFKGNARAQGQTVTWSLILKAMGGSSDVGSNDPSNWRYWKREVLAYQSGLLDDLPGSLVAPRCFGVVEYPGEEFWVWLEDISDESGSVWPLERYGLAARHLGQFNGAYCMGQPVPETPWLSKGRIRDWLNEGEPAIRDLHRLSEHPIARRWLTDETVGRIHRLWSKREMFLEALDRLPRCLCHHDAFRRNLMSRRKIDGSDVTVAIDWALVGTGFLGEEIATLVTVSLQFFDVDITEAKTLEAIAIEGYLAGLQDVGWRGDAHITRFGFTAAASLFMGVGAVGMWLPILLEEETSRSVEKVFGHPLESILARFAALQDYLLDLGDEARELINVSE
ncbi:MAG: phosphotransferase [Anaerolineaceae bacterium]|nr:phosphotransferase [Anaerolineaceae bacterium]